MKDFVIKTNSWHYKLAKWSDNYVADDMCTYTNQVIKGGFIFLLATLVATLAAKALVEIVIGIVFSLVYGMLIFSPLAAISMVSIGVVGGAVSMVFGFHYLSDKIRGMSYKKDDAGFVASSYRSFKDKFCVRLSFEQKE